jgi:uncharacterized membrane protein
MDHGGPGSSLLSSVARIPGPRHEIPDWYDSVYLPDMADLATREGQVAARRIARPVDRPSLTALLPPALLALCTLAYAAFFGWLSLERYWSYSMHALDMGNMGQAAWNTVHGHPFQFTNMRLPWNIEAWGTTTRLSFHVEALFPAISLVYLLYPKPESLLVLQTIALALGAPAVYLLARDVLNVPWLALVFSAVYLAFPSLEALNLYEFHPVAVATPLLLWAFWFLWRGRSVPFVLCCLAAMGTKEQIGLVVAMFGLYAAFFRGERRIGVSLTAIGVLWSLFAALVIEHHFRSPGTLTYLHTRYGYLGHGVTGAVHTLTHDPGVVLRVVFIWPKLGYLLRLLLPAGLVALAAPIALLLGAPTFLLNVLSTDSHMYSGLGDNSAELISVVMIASILGARRLLDGLNGRVPPRRGHVLIGCYILLAGLLAQAMDGFTPLGARFQLPSMGTHTHLANRFVAMVPAEAPVSAQDVLDPHLSSRRYLYLFRDMGVDPPLVPATYALLDASSPVYPLPSDQNHDAAMSILRQAGWGIAAASDGLLLLHRGASVKQIPAAFYTFLDADQDHPDHPLSLSRGGLRLLGYSVSRTDLANYRVPNLAYTFFLRRTGAPQQDLQPVVYGTLGGRLVSCTSDALGLSWLPPSRWRQGHTYMVHMQPLQSATSSLGTIHLSVELRPMAQATSDSCDALWRDHGRLETVGSLRVWL